MAAKEEQNSVNQWPGGRTCTYGRAAAACRSASRKMGEQMSFVWYDTQKRVLEKLLPIVLSPHFHTTHDRGYYRLTLYGHRLTTVV